MAKVSKKISVSANGVLAIDNDGMFVAVEDGPTIALDKLLAEMDGKLIKLSASYDEEYDGEADIEVNEETGEVI